MKNGRQPKTTIQVRRTGKRAAIQAENARTLAKRAAKAHAAQIKGQVLVNAANLLPSKSYGIPDFVTRGFYVDMPFSCKACCKPQLWTATQQKWWYEAAKGDVWTIAFYADHAGCAGVIEVPLREKYISMGWQERRSMKASSTFQELLNRHQAGELADYNVKANHAPMSVRKQHR